MDRDEAAAAVPEGSWTSRLRRRREETPGCAERLHLNNAGAALPPRSVLEAMTRHLEREARIGGYEAEEEAAAAAARAYQDLERLLGAPAGGVALVENATVAVAQALSAFDFQPGDRIVTSRADYTSNQIMYLSLGRRLGVETARAADLPEGGVDPQSVRELARHPRCRLVSLTWIPTNSGLVQPAEEVGAVCAELGVPYLVDACQAVGQRPVDVALLRCDFLAGTARKFLRGPRGIGFLYVSGRALERGAHPLFVDMRGADWTGPDAFRLAAGARRFENWEFSWALVLGLGEAARYALEVGPEGCARARELAAALRRRLAELPGARVMDRGAELGAIVTAAFAGREPDELKLRLRERGINVSVSRRQDALLDLDDKGVPAVLRLSPHYYNTDEEIAAGAPSLGELLERRAAS